MFDANLVTQDQNLSFDVEAVKAGGWQRERQRRSVLDRVGASTRRAVCKGIRLRYKHVSIDRDTNELLIMDALRDSFEPNFRLWDPESKRSALDFEKAINDRMRTLASQGQNNGA